MKINISSIDYSTSDYYRGRVDYMMFATLFPGIGFVFKMPYYTRIVFPGNKSIKIRMRNNYKEAPDGTES